MPVNGIDVSEFQGNINWNEVKESGVKFAILREGYSTQTNGNIDPKFVENYNNASAVEIPLGAYHYSTALNSREAREEAEFCLKNIDNRKLEYPICFDIESSEQLSPDNKTRTDICIAFCEEIEKAGYYAMIYCSLNWWENYLISEELASKYDLWLAQYDVRYPSVSCGMWQKGQSNEIGGINGSVDIDEAFKDYPSIIKNKGLNGFEKSDPSIPEAPIENEFYIDYRVKSGDTLSEISKNYNVSIEKLAEVNGIKNVDLIYSGQLLLIPSNKVQDFSVFYYKVLMGDTLSGIANKFNTTVEELVKLNGIKDANLIYVNQILKVPR